MTIKNFAFSSIFFKALILFSYLLCGTATFAAKSPDLLMIEQQLTQIIEPSKRVDYISRQIVISNDWSTPDKAQLLHYLAAAQQANKAFEPAYQSYSTIIDILSDTPTSTLLIQSYLDRSSLIYLQTNDHKKYCPDRITAVELARKQPDQILLATALTQVAYCFNQASNFDVGLMHLEQALDIAKTHQLDANKLALMFEATASIYRDNHLHKQAESYFLQAFEHWQQIKNTQNMFTMLHNLVGEAIMLAKWDSAAKYLEQMQTLQTKTPEYKDFAFFYNFNRGRYYFELHDFDASTQAFEAAQGLSATTDEAFYVTQNLGFLALSLFHYQDIVTAGQVAETFLNSDNISSQSASLIEQVRAVYSSSKGDHFSAQEYLFAAIDIERNHMEETVANDVVLNSLNHNVKMANYENELLEKALAINKLNLKNQMAKQSITKLSMIIFIVIAISLSAVVIFLIYSRKQFIRRSQTDFLTGIANRRHTFIEGRKRLAYCHEHQQPFTLILFDIDHFKHINDKFGHDIGDKAIVAAVGRCQSYIKRSDIIGRVGGEEFLCVFPNTSQADAMQIAERIRKVVAEQAFIFGEVTVAFTISLGVAVLEPNTHIDTDIDNKVSEQLFSDLAKKADLAMYKAKNQGRNQVQLYLENV